MDIQTSGLFGFYCLGLRKGLVYNTKLEYRFVRKNYGFFFWGGAELPDTINTRVNTDTEISYNFLHRRERHRARISKAYNSKGRKPHISIAPPGQ